MGSGPILARAARMLEGIRIRPWAPRLGLGLTLLILVLPGFVYPYLYDDFDFLVRALRFQPANLLPDPSVIFYRPVSRDLYFGLLQWVSANGPMLGHVLNTAAVLAACLICATLAATFLGARQGILAGLLFAGCGQIPLLVAWVSGCQDALAIFFTLAALLLEVRGRHLAAVAVAALAILSKETAVAVIPAIALASRILVKDPQRSNSRVFDYAILLVIWGAIHPGIHLLMHRGFRSGGVEYVGIDHPNWLGSMGRYGALLLNLPPLGMTAEWPKALTPIAVLAALMGGLVLLLSGGSRGVEAEPLPPRRSFLLVALAAAAGPILLTSLLVAHWAPYYAAFPAIGAAWLLAAGIGRLPTYLQAPLIAAYIVAGVAIRGLAVDVGIPTERNMAAAAAALKRLEPQFRALQPAMEPGAQVLVASQVRGAASVHVHLYTFQVLRQWYRSADIRVVRPELRLPGRPAEYLFWVNRDLNVYQVDLQTFLPRSVSEGARFNEYQGVLRAYTRGLAESNELDRAVWLLLTMPEPDIEHRGWDRRIAASYLLAFGRRTEAQRLIDDAPAVDRALAIDLVVELLAQPTRSPRYDLATMEAFGLDVRSPEDLAQIAERMALTMDAAGSRFAKRLLELRPGDPRAMSILRAYERQGPSERITSPQPGE